MKKFEVGQRVAFSDAGERKRGTISGVFLVANCLHIKGDDRQIYVRYPEECKHLIPKEKSNNQTYRREVVIFNDPQKGIYFEGDIPTVERSYRAVEIGPGEMIVGNERLVKAWNKVMSSEKHHVDHRDLLEALEATARETLEAK